MRNVGLAEERVARVSLKRSAAMLESRRQGEGGFYTLRKRRRGSARAGRIWAYEDEKQKGGLASLW